MAGVKGKPKTGGKPFEKGYDPRRWNKGTVVDVEVTEIKADVRMKLARHFQKFFDLPVSELEVASTAPDLTLGERMSLRFLVEAAKRGDPARISLLARIIGLEVPQAPVSVEITTPVRQITMADVRAAFNKDKFIEKEGECQDAIIVESPTNKTGS